MADDTTGLTRDSKSGISLEDLVDIDKTKKTTGRKPSGVTSQLSVACLHRGTGKLYWRCRGPGCGHFRAGNSQVARIANHTMECKHVSPAQKELASTWSTQNALGAKVAPKELRIEPQEDSSGSSCKKARLLQSTLRDATIAKGTVKFDEEINISKTIELL